ncbi:MAG: amidohydrolase family protein [Chloroflexota bacterium]|nr:amidohydrolase family protein [Chloroflexota bacterium]
MVKPNDTPRLTLIQHGLVHAPEPKGVQSVLLAGQEIVALGTINQDALQTLGLPYSVVDASDCVVTPGWIDPHEHILGAGGEQGWNSRTAEVGVSELLRAGITTVVGCLGTDTVTRTLPALLAKAQQLEADGVSAYIYTGGFWVPPQTLTGSIMDDLVIIDKVVGAGELAIADTRSPEPTRDTLAQIVSQAVVGSSIAGKAGVIHFHVGSGDRRLALLNALLDEHDIPPRHLYPTHITRSEALMDEAIALAKRGAYVDIDVVDDNLWQCLRYYGDHGGDFAQLTVSSDAQTPGGSPTKLYRNVVAAVQEGGFTLDDVLPLVTLNPARVLKLDRKGRLAEGLDGDVLVLRQDTLEVVHVFARGKHLVKGGQVALESTQEQPAAS